MTGKDILPPFSFPPALWPVSYYLLGDLNLDGIINALDIVLIVNLVLANEYSSIADINEDGIVNILDIVQLVNIIFS